MEGLPYHPEDLIRYGHRLTFSCVGELILRGPKEITCQSNGEWSSPFPKCVGKVTDCKQLSTSKSVLCKTKFHARRQKSLSLAIN